MFLLKVIQYITITITKEKHHDKIIFLFKSKQRTNDRIDFLLDINSFDSLSFDKERELDVYETINYYFTKINYWINSKNS